jgi:HKD family nuclease
MFVQNQISHLANHENIITNEIDNADEILFVVAYVRENGVDVILDKMKNKPTKLLCSLDMGITQLSGIKRLLENGIEVKVYKSNKGTFHPKIWLFGKSKKWKMLIGSANLTRAAFIDNVEASVLVDDENATSNALIFFNYLWDKKNSNTITIDEVNSLQEKVKERKAFKNKPAQIEDSQNDIKKTEVLLEYVKNWIDIPKYDSKGISSLWRGWYIIPDHGYVTEQYIEDLRSYLPFIDNGIALGQNSTDKNYKKLLDKFKENSNFKKQILKTPMHALFTKQAKNYLIKFGWCYQPDRGTLCLTDLGFQVWQCTDLKCVNLLYSDYFYNYTYNGLNIIHFTEQLLQMLEYLTFDEFNYFVIHAYNTEDLNIIANLVKIYRTLINTEQFEQEFKEYFEQKKGNTAKSVYANYTKSAKHTLSVISWCNGFLKNNDFVLRLDHAN